MTQPQADFMPYPDEFQKIAVVMTRLQNAFDFTHLTETNKAVFDMAAHEEFAKVGITVRVNWAEYTDKDGHELGVWEPGIEPIGRTRKETETDHDRIKYGIVKGLDGGQPGYLREDGTVHEEPIRKIIT